MALRFSLNRSLLLIQKYFYLVIIYILWHLNCHKQDKFYLVKPKSSLVWLSNLWHGAIYMLAYIFNIIIYKLIEFLNWATSLFYNVLFIVIYDFDFRRSDLPRNLLLDHAKITKKNRQQDYLPHATIALYIYKLIGQTFSCVLVLGYIHWHHSYSTATWHLHFYLQDITIW